MRSAQSEPHARLKRVLVAEDEVLVAMLIEAELGDAGFEVIGAFATCAEASAWLDSDTPDAAVLDLHLKDGPCVEVATELVRRGVPIVTLTGAYEGEIPSVLQSVPVIEKPFDLVELPGILMDLQRPYRQEASSLPSSATTASNE